MINNAETIAEGFTERELTLIPGTPPPMDTDDLTPIIRPFLVKNRIPIKDVVPYCERVYRDWRELKDFLPFGKSHIVDIGCGWCGHDLYLANYYKTVKFSLVDGTKTIPKIHTGFRDDAQPYRNGNIGMRLLNSGGFRARLYPVSEATNNETFVWADFVVSFCAYGHHFPAHTYLPLIQRSLVGGGHLLVDIRQQTNGQEQIEAAGFTVVQVIKEKPKFTRFLFEKKRTL